MIHHLVFGRKAIVKNEGLILDLPFQNSFVDATGKNTMIAGGTSNLPTFTLEGGEYAATFNGSKSLKTNANFVLGTDKVSISFWMKTTQTTEGIFVELSSNYGSNNAFRANIFTNKGTMGSHTSAGFNFVLTNSNINDGSWKHIVMINDRSKSGTNETQIYINKILDYSNNITTNLSGIFDNFTLFIGQRNGSSFGFNGQMKFLKIFNYPLSTTEITNLYNKTI